MSTSVRKYHLGDVPDRVLAAARTLLDDQPAADISVRELARTAGVSHAAPYRHFGDRDGLLAALAARCFAEFIDEQRRAYDAAPPGNRLLDVGLAYVDYATAHPNAFALVFDPTVSPADAPPESHQPLIAAHTELLVAAIDDAVSARRLSAAVAPDDLGAAVWSAAHGLAGLIISGRIDRSRAPAVLAALLT
ncbi:MAG: TetR/AcrR family transcriptional regulator [Acidimicrobiales bacterium]